MSSSRRSMRQGSAGQSAWMAGRQSGDGGSATRRSFWVAAACCAFSVTAMTISVSYSALHKLPAAARADFSSGPTNGLVGVVFVAAFATVGGLLAWKRPANPIGWLLSAIGCVFAIGGIGPVLACFPGLLSPALWFGWSWLFGLSLAVPVLLLFPTGGLLSRRWRPAARAAYAGSVAWLAGNAFAPTILTASPARLANPIGVPAPAGRVFDALAVAGALLSAGAALAGVLSLILRYRRAQLVEREQLNGWFTSPD